MPIYSYTAKKGPTEIVKSEIEAESEDKAVVMIEAMGFFPIKVVELRPPSATPRAPERAKPEAPPVAANKEQGLSSVKVGAHDMDTFMWQLASLIKSSIPLLRALSLIARQTKNKSLKAVAGDLELKIKQGELLSAAMSKYPNLFNNLTVNMIKAGEKSGSLDEVLYKLAEYREKEQEMKRKIQSALAYPMVVVAVGIGTIFMMFTYFLPKLLKLFENMKQELPLPTKLLIATSKFMSSYWYVFVIGIVFVIAVIFRNKPGSRKKFMLDMFCLRVPFINKFIKTSEIARFARSLGLLLKNGIPVYESLDLAAKTLDNQALKTQLAQASAVIVNQGCTISESFRRTGVFPEFTINMIAVGEEGGRLEESLAEIAASYEKEVEQTIKVMTSMIEPLLILIVGGFVGFIVFAMLLPILNMGGMGG
ncbi:MAG: type II secretion system F family protein [Candidatus Omnitrophica bacterium]|nr:type II secretion system F family protein [Candidatus Omnitrophota bacterium]